MAKEITGYVKLQVKGGQANPAPPVGPALGSKGVNIMEFCKQFNARTQDKMGKVVPVIITVYSDKSFDFVIKTAPAAVQLMEAAKIQKGSKESNRIKVGKVSWAQVEEIAKDKMPDLNCFTVESAMKMVAGTARSMGLTVGSCAQIGKGVHLSGGVGIGGVLEPLQAGPVIIEDGAFIGSRCIVVEGVRVESEAVLGANVVLTQSTKIIDVSGAEPVIYQGRVPARSVV